MVSETTQSRVDSTAAFALTRQLLRAMIGLPPYLLGERRLERDDRYARRKDGGNVTVWPLESALAEAAHEITGSATIIRIAGIWEVIYGNGTNDRVIEPDGRSAIGTW